GLLRLPDHSRLAGEHLALAAAHLLSQLQPGLHPRDAAAALVVSMRSGREGAHPAGGRLPAGKKGHRMTALVDAPIRTRPFADPCYIGGRERELLLDVLESCRWSGFRAGTHGRDAREICS